MNATVAVLITIALSLVTVLSDSFIKHSSLQKSFAGWKWLVLGAMLYALTAIGWFFVMRKIKLSTLGVVYSVSIVLCLTLVSVFYFKEKLSSTEIVGIVMAISALLLLSRFS